MSARRRWLARAAARLAVARLAVAASAPLAPGARWRAIGGLLAAPAATDVAADAGDVDAAAPYPDVRVGERFVFPRDHGAHPAYRTEWWYATGWLRTADGRDLGVQITFFRNRPRLQEGSASRFAPTQLVFAHAAIADPAHGRLRHDQRAARSGLGLAHAALDTTDVAVDGWTLVLDGDRYRTRIAARDFTLALVLRASGAVLAQGVDGTSRKGPRETQASRYYSRPQLDVTGEVTLAGGAAVAVTGRAWLDHEWSSEILDADAVGWDWTGLNLDDGGALTAFRIRDADGGVRWAGGSLRDAAGRVQVFAPRDVRLAPLRTWTSARTGARYPVAMRIDVPGRALILEPLLDDQELDARASTGTVYWEGAVRARDADGRAAGRGYLELTGYWRPVKL
ncbi:MAG: carotenoid 1,2-hydratase [Burkholderiales bacterium]|nr:carotenoid 1,2-hydratase [Burkholderiales bacterium]